MIAIVGGMDGGSIGVQLELGDGQRIVCWDGVGVGDGRDGLFGEISLNGVGSRHGGDELIVRNLKDSSQLLISTTVAINTLRFEM